MVRKTDMRFLLRFLAQFTEAYTNVPTRILKRLIYKLNVFYFKHIRIPYLAIGNLMYFRKITG
jgi:hypothetical protein